MLYTLEFSLMKALEGSLLADDPGWLAFGLKIPATKTTPGQPQNVTAMAGGNGEVLVQCDPTPLANRYRCRGRIVGVQTDYQLLWSGTESMGAIKGIQPGVTLEIIMQAVNGGNQGVASEPILFTVPVAVTATASAEAAAPLKATATSNGNGNGSTNGQGQRAVSRVSYARLRLVSYHEPVSPEGGTGFCVGSRGSTDSGSGRLTAETQRTQRGDESGRF